MNTIKAIVLPKNWADENPSMWHWILEHGPDKAEVIELTEETKVEHVVSDDHGHYGYTDRFQRWVSQWTKEVSDEDYGD